MENNQFAEDRLVFLDQMEKLLSRLLLPEALNTAEVRLSRFPGDMETRAFVNVVLIAMGRIEESRNVLQDLEKDIIGLSFAYLRSADAYREKGLNQDAVLCYRKFLSLNPQAENSREIAEKITLLEKELPSAMTVDEAVGADMPGPEFYTLTLAEIYINQGHPKMAAGILEEIIKREPANVQAREKLAAVVATLGRSSSPAAAAASPENLIRTLSSWLENIDRLKKHAM